MKKVLTKVKDWFVAHKPTKRKIIQLYAALLTNANIKGFVSGDIYKGDTKKMCVPGLNCYSCPGAVGACPLGALQDSLASSDKRFPAYILGILLLFGLLLGRTICGFLCPFGLVQELIYKIRTPKLRKSRFTRVLSYFKYVLLALTISLPIIFAGIPAFCQYVCPAGMLGGSVSLLANINNSGLYSLLDILFSWKFCVLVVVVVACVFIYRFFCRFICPLGAIYGFFSKISLIGVKLDKNKCIDCGLCIQGCKMDIKHVGDHECIHCGECISVCPVQAISWKGSEIFVRNTTPVASVAVADGEKIDLLSLAKNNASVIVAPVSSDAASESEVVTESLAKAETEIAVSEDLENGQAEIVETTEAHANEITEGEKPSRAKAWLARQKANFKRPRFVVEFVAWVVATVVLITALICYNLPEAKAVSLPEIALTTYSSAASEGGKEYKVETGNGKFKLLYFWRTDLDEAIAGVDELPAYAELFGDKLEIVVIHTLKDGDDVQSFIDDRGWNKYDIVFAQDTDATNAYMHFGGDTSVPEAVTVVARQDGTIVSTEKGAPDFDKLKSDLILAQRGIVYKVGDYSPIFEVKCYNPEEDGHIFSTAAARGKVTVINYWYTDCAPCKLELPHFNSIYEEYAGEINIVAVHDFNSQPPRGVQAWLDDESNVDKNGKSWGSYSLTFAQDRADLNTYAMFGGRGAFPITAIVDAEGKISYVNLNPCSETELRAAIEAAMQG